MHQMTLAFFEEKTLSSIHGGQIRLWVRDLLVDVSFVV
jgi:hypothetical protein